MATLAFWPVAALLAYVWAGYPLLLHLWRRRPEPDAERAALALRLIGPREWNLLTTSTRRLLTSRAEVTTP
jgi:hypothetical protein